MKRWSAAMLFGVGCSAGPGKNGAIYYSGDAAPTATSYTSASDTGGADATTGTSDTGAVPVWWQIGGHIDLLYGAVDLTTSLLTVTLEDAYQAPLCTRKGAPVSATDATPPDPGLITWWNIVFAASDDCGGPAGVSLGFGPYDALLDPSAVAQGLPTDTLNGLYLLQGGDLWIVGVAGSPQQFGGDGYPVAAGPLPDGTWKIQTLYLLPL